MRVHSTFGSSFVVRQAVATETQRQWSWILANITGRVGDAFRVAYDDERLRALFPFRSLNCACFSVATSYPYNALPFIDAQGQIAPDFAARDSSNGLVLQGSLLAVVGAVSALVAELDLNAIAAVEVELP